MCTSAVDPTTSIEFPTSAAFCDGNIINGTVSHAAQLGVFCLENGNLFSEVVGQEVAYFWDLFSECGDQYHEVVNLNELGSDVSNTTRFTCVKSATFPVGSSPSDTNVIPRVSVTTDRRWGSSLTFRSCVEATNSVPSFPTTPSPKISPNPTGTPLTISPPTLMSTIAPGAQIPTVTIGQPLSSPSSMIPVVNGTVSSAGRSVTGSSNALTIGSAFIGAVGVLLVAGLIIFIIFRRSSHDTRNANDVSIELHNEVDVSIELYNEVDMLSSNVSTEGVGSSWTNPKMEHPSRSLQFKDQAQDVRKGPTSNPRVKVASIQDRPLADVFRRKEEQHLRSSINNADRHRGLDP